MPKGNTNAIRIGNLHLATARLPSHIHQSKSTVQGVVSFFTGYPPPKGAYLNIVLPTEDLLSLPTCSPLDNQGIHFFCFCFFHSFYWKATKDSTTQKHVVGRVDTPRTVFSRTNSPHHSTDKSGEYY